MDMEKLAAIFEAVKVMPLRTDDIIVLRMEQEVTHEVADRLKASLREILGDRTVLVLGGGMDIEIVRPEKAESST